MNLQKEPTLECPICKSFNTFKLGYLPGWKCNDCGVHFYEKITEVKNE